MSLIIPASSNSFQGENVVNPLKVDSRGFYVVEIKKDSIAIKKVNLITYLWGKIKECFIPDYKLNSLTSLSIKAVFWAETLEKAIKENEPLNFDVLIHSARNIGILTKKTKEMIYSVFKNLEKPSSDNYLTLSRRIQQKYSKALSEKLRQKLENILTTTPSIEESTSIQDSAPSDSVPQKFIGAFSKESPKEITQPVIVIKSGAKETLHEELKEVQQEHGNSKLVGSLGLFGILSTILYILKGGWKKPGKSDRCDRDSKFMFENDGKKTELLEEKMKLDSDENVIVRDLEGKGENDTSDDSIIELQNELEDGIQIVSDEKVFEIRGVEGEGKKGGFDSINLNLPENISAEFKAILDKYVGSNGISYVKKNVSYPYLAGLGLSTMQKIARYYRTKYGININLCFVENVEEYLSNLPNEGLGGIILIRKNNPTGHAIPLLYNLTAEKREFMVLDPVPTYTLDNIKKQPSDTWVFTNTFRQADYYSCRTGALALLRNALLDIRRRKSKREFRDLESLMIKKPSQYENLTFVLPPPEWSYIEQIFPKEWQNESIAIIQDTTSSKKTKKNNPRTIKQFREQHSNKMVYAYEYKLYEYKLNELYLDIENSKFIASKIDNPEPGITVSKEGEDYIIKWEISRVFNTYLLHKGYKYAVKHGEANITHAARNWETTASEIKKPKTLT